MDHLDATRARARRRRRRRPARPVPVPVRVGVGVGVAWRGVARRGEAGRQAGRQAGGGGERADGRARPLFLTLSFL